MSVAPVLATSISSGSPSLFRNWAEVARTDVFMVTKRTRFKPTLPGGLPVLDDAP